MAGNGLWADLSCRQMPDGKGGVDIKIAGSTVPEFGEGTTRTTISGVMHNNGTIEGEMLQTDYYGTPELRANTNGTGVITKPYLKSDKPFPEIARQALRPAAEACKASLLKVPGVAG